MAEKQNTPEIRFEGFTDPWEQRKLGGLFFESNERSSSMEILSVSVAKGIYPASESDRDTNPGASLANYKVVHKGDVVYNSMRMWQGAVGSSDYDGIVSPAYVVARPAIELDSTCFGYLLKRPEMLYKYLCDSQGNSKDTQTLKYNRFADIEVTMPANLEEQRVISACLGRVDTLITLHQRKYDKLCTVKKSMLDKMFPKLGETEPEIRFEGFTDPWEQRKLGELCTFSKGHGYSKADIRDAGTPLILYGRLYTQYESRIEEVDTFTVEQDGSILSRGNEVIVPASGETAEDIAIASSVRRSGIILGGDLNVVTPTGKLDPDYTALAITYSKAHDDLAKRAQGKSVVHVHGNDIAEVEISYPSESEQKRISSVVLNLDSLITLHQRKLELLRNIKKSLLDRMFV